MGTVGSARAFQDGHEVEQDLDDEHDHDEDHEHDDELDALPSHEISEETTLGGVATA
jgi:hypothetical protein